MRRIVLSRPDRLGDVIITSSLLPILYAAWGDVELHWLIARPFHPLFQDHPLLSGLIFKDQAAQALKSLRPDAIIHFHPDPLIEKAAAEVGIPHRIGYRRSCWSTSLTTAAMDDRPMGLKHEAVYALDLASHLHPLPRIVNKLKPSLSLRKSVSLLNKLSPSAILSEYAVINPSAHSQSLRWPWENFLELSRWLWKTHDLKTILICGEADDLSIQILSKAMTSEDLPYINLAGRLELDELALLLSRAKLHVARDTGTSHLAAAMGCPQVEIFMRNYGKYSVTRWQALASRSVIVRPNLDQEFFESNPGFWSRCAQSISVGSVCHAVQQALAFPHATE